MSQAVNEDPLARMTLRRMPFEYVQGGDAHWNKNEPEFFPDSELRVDGHALP